MVAYFCDIGMKAIGYYIALPFIYGISLMPFWLMYLVSDFIHFLLFSIAGYRQGVVRTNLANSFPDKTEEELNQIRDQFNRYFCDLILETFKTLTIKKSVLKDRVSFENSELFERYFDQKQSIILVLGHLGNWELCGAGFSQFDYHQLFVIYRPLKNKYFDGLVHHMRTRLGNKLYAMKDSFRGMIRDRGQVTATAFIADQSPPPDTAYWTTFLRQETGVFRGTAKIARKLNYPVVYSSISRPRRGFYRIKLETLIERPADLTEDEISERHTRRLERDIDSNPSYWLWTHRRWKHKRPANE